MNGKERLHANLCKNPVEEQQKWPYNGIIAV